jgi:hypothetical protein
MRMLNIEMSGDAFHLSKDLYPKRTKVSNLRYIEEINTKIIIKGIDVVFDMFLDAGLIQASDHIVDFAVGMDNIHVLKKLRERGFRYGGHEEKVVPHKLLSDCNMATFDAMLELIPDYMLCNECLNPNDDIRKIIAFLERGARPRAYFSMALQECDDARGIFLRLKKYYDKWDLTNAAQCCITLPQFSLSYLEEILKCGPDMEVIQHLGLESVSIAAIAMLIKYGYDISLLSQETIIRVENYRTMINIIKRS